MISMSFKEPSEVFDNCVKGGYLQQVRIVVVVSESYQYAGKRASTSLFRCAYPIAEIVENIEFVVKAPIIPILAFIVRIYLIYI